MRYHHNSETPPTDIFSKTYHCNHPIYDVCTLIKIGDKGLAVIQQRRTSKHTYWSAVDKGLADELYTHPKFMKYFNLHAAEPDNRGLYPTVTIRQAMWALRMKPLERHRWETYFDRPEV